MSTRRPALFLALLTAGAACSDGGGPADPGDLVLAILEGDNQTAIGNTEVTVDPAVLVTEDGDPKSGVAVTFAVVTGGGALTGANATTNASGIARLTSWQLGAPGIPQQLTATVNGADGSPVSFTATSITGPFHQVVSEVAADLGTATAGQATTIKPVVRAMDIGGNPIAGVVLAWNVVEGGGTVQAPVLVSGVDGRATIGDWVLGQVAGAQRLHLTTPNEAGTIPIEYTALAVAGPVASIEKIAGDFQNAIISTNVAVAPKVLLKDIFGNLVTNRPVAFAVTLGGGAVSGGTPTSAADGTAAVTSWTMGGTPGENRLSASIDGNSVTFTATATPGFNPAPFAGTYAGTWTNTTFASMGTGTAIVTVNTGNNTATVTATATGNVLGSGGGATPPLQNGTYNSNGAQFTGSVAPMGTINASILPPGNITAVGTNVPSGSITGWTATGTIDGTTIQLSFTVTFTAGPPAVGTITLTRQ